MISTDRGYIPEVVDVNIDYLNQIIDKAYVQLGTGCWIYSDNLNDEWGRPWMVYEGDKYRVDCIVFDWYNGGPAPRNGDVESICGVYGCCNPRCLVFEPNPEDS